METMARSGYSENNPHQHALHFKQLQAEDLPAFLPYDIVSLRRKPSFTPPNIPLLLHTHTSTSQQWSAVVAVLGYSMTVCQLHRLYAAERKEHCGRSIGMDMEKKQE
jgi:hypothetical protein